jgi:sucrose-6-phosphate hydrolase SacC (GH32 family)
VAKKLTRLVWNNIPGSLLPDAASDTVSGNSVVQRTETGTVRTADATDNGDAVNLGQMNTALNNKQNQVTATMTDLTAGVTALATGDIVVVYE